MAERVITVAIPEFLYQRLEEVAKASGWEFENVLLQSIRSGMPPSLSRVPKAFHAKLLELNALGDQELWEVGQGEQTKDDTANEAEKVGLLTLQRAYAFALLRWRGHPVPDPTEYLLD